MEWVKMRKSGDEVVKNREKMKGKWGESGDLGLKRVKSTGKFCGHMSAKIGFFVFWDLEKEPFSPLHSSLSFKINHFHPPLPHQPFKINPFHNHRSPNTVHSHHTPPHIVYSNYTLSLFPLLSPTTPITFSSYTYYIIYTISPLTSHLSHLTPLYFYILNY